MSSGLAKGLAILIVGWVVLGVLFGIGCFLWIVGVGVAGAVQDTVMGDTHEVTPEPTYTLVRPTPETAPTLSQRRWGSNPGTKVIAVKMINKGSKKDEFYFYKYEFTALSQPWEVHIATGRMDDSKGRNWLWENGYNNLSHKSGGAYDSMIWMTEYPKDRIIAKRFLQNEAMLDLTFPEKVEVIREYVQKGIEYKPDGGDSKIPDWCQYPAETILKGTGDCEDKAALMAVLLKEAGADVALIRFPKHIVVGIRQEDIQQDLKARYGKNSWPEVYPGGYVLIDTLGNSSRPGEWVAENWDHNKKSDAIITELKYLPNT